MGTEKAQAESGKPAISKKDGEVIAVFGENDGGHSFVALCELLDGEKLYDIVPQEDVWIASDAVRDEHANVGLIPLSNSITQTEAATLTALATGELKVIARVSKQTDHVLVALKDNILQVQTAAQKNGGKVKRYQEGTYSNIRDDGAGSQDGAAQADDDGLVVPTADGLKEYVFLLRKVFSSTLIYEQTRGKLTGSDFRHIVDMEHTANPVRVLLRILRESKTQDVWNRLHPTRSAGNTVNPSISLGGAPFPPLAQPQVVRAEPVNADFFAAALVAEGLLGKALKVCSIDGRACSQRLSEVSDRLEELTVNSRPPRDLPSHETTFLLVAPAEWKKAGKFADVYAEQGGALKADGIIPWADGLTLDQCTWRATFLITPPKKVGETGWNWSQSFKNFEKDLSARFRDLDVVFDSSPELVNDRKRKTKLLITARFMPKATSLRGNRGLGAHLDESLRTKLKDREKTIKRMEETTSSFVTIDEHQMFGAKLLGVYPSWRSTKQKDGSLIWVAEAASGKAKDVIKPGDMGRVWAFVALGVILFLAVAWMIAESPLLLSALQWMWNVLTGWFSVMFPTTR